jgi:hypothetical protein
MVLSAAATNAQLGLLLHAAVMMTALKLSDLRNRLLDAGAVLERLMTKKE